jgi:hypothetical protein
MSDPISLLPAAPTVGPSDLVPIVQGGTTKRATGAMFGQPAVHAQAAAATLSGGEAMLVSQASAAVTITATTISAQASDNSFNDSGNGFVTAGFTVGTDVRVQGFTGSGANNIYSGRVTAVAPGKLTIGGADGDAIVDDAAGESVTITKWETRRATAQDVANLAGGGAPDAVALSIASGVVDVDCSLSDYFTLTLTANVTSITFSNLPGSGKAATKWIEIVQGAGPYTVAWPASFKWAGGSAGAVSTGNGDVDELAITTLNNGSAWKATLAKDFS